MTKTLRHGEFVKLQAWVNSVATVGTIKGFVKPDVVEETLARCKEKGWEIVWTNLRPSFLCNSPEFYAKRDEEISSATILTDKEVVEIEGKLWMVSVNKGNEGTTPKNSDPIKFLEVK